MSAFGGKADILDGAEKGWITAIHFPRLQSCLPRYGKLTKYISKNCRAPVRGITENARPHPHGGSGQGVTRQHLVT